MNHDTLNMLVKFIFSARKITGPIEANRLAVDEVYRNEIFNKIEGEGDAKLLEAMMLLRDKLAMKESIASSNAYKDIPIDFDHYKDKAKNEEQYAFGARG